jgi:hypothetical protein
MEKNATSRQTSQYRVEKYLKALIKMHEQIKSPRAFNMQNFMEENSLSTNLGTILQKEKMILKIGENKRTPVYKWNTIPPNIHMTIKILDEMKKYNAEWKKSREIPKVSNTQKVLKLEGSSGTRSAVANIVVKESAKKRIVKQKQVTPEIKLREVSLLWGLFKMNY